MLFAEQLIELQAWPSSDLQQEPTWLLSRWELT
jgi:hypothetical protein